MLFEARIVRYVFDKNTKMVLLDVFEIHAVSTKQLACEAVALFLGGLLKLLNNTPPKNKATASQATKQLAIIHTQECN